MISYKTPQADLESKKGLFFEIGLAVALLSIFLAFQIKRPSRTTTFDFDYGELNIIQEEMIQTHQPTTPPPPKQPMQQITLLTVVENTEEVETEIHIQAEVDQQTEIPEYTPLERPMEEEAIQEEEIFLVVEDQPEFPGGEAALMTYFANNIRYPSGARELGIQGTVYVSFVVEPDGSVSQIEVLRGIGGGCDEEAVRVVQNMPLWKPGKQRNIPVRVRFNLPVRFKLL
ncbi:MAG: energy transducer TonB [Bacteroidales bacterium]|jgi:protein TonB|nr:energy transducer TonB [Bacteroidales bacterium]MDD4087031.1 energy transducer TonB [Bacteroidales bacterium]MDY0084896.1 energy transducer TonB [Bacteroidales bacterium]